MGYSKFTNDGDQKKNNKALEAAKAILKPLIGGFLKPIRYIGAVLKERRQNKLNKGEGRNH